MGDAVVEGERVDEGFQRRAGRAQRARQVERAGAFRREVIDAADRGADLAGLVVYGEDRDRDLWRKAEAARLLGIDTEDVQRDRYSACAELVSRSGQIVVLKGARTIVQGPHTAAYVCAEGSPALGVAGTGDVLAGVIAAVLGGKDAPRKVQIDRVCEAVIAHALAGVRAAQGRDRGLFASEVADAVSYVLAPS